ncbi:dNA-binding helix-turn-helix protein [Mycoplasma sp. CAG:776]|nr:dNA-binding helix-turn-helix protein [Mycoplasma sp. CAG:776]
MRLKDIREESELKQFTVGELIGVTKGTYSLWELELDIIPLKRLNSFCNAFNCSIDYALGFTNTKNYKHSKKEININLSAKRLKEIRKEHKHTQEYIGKKLSLNRSLISKYEKGHTLISTTFLMEYVKLYHISSDYLLGKIDTKIIIKEADILTFNNQVI